MNIKKNTKYIAAVSSLCIALVAFYEGFSPTVYKDSVGVETIGYGHTGPDVNTYKFISKSEGYKILEKDIDKHWNGIKPYIKVKLTQGEVDAYTSFAFNVGITRFKNSTLLKKLNNENHTGACAELKKWVYAGGKKLNGLVKRRNAEYKICMKGLT